MENVFKTTDRLNRFDENGQEILNPTPMQPPLGYKKQPSLAMQIREQVRAYHLQNSDMEPETEEEADDFDIPDDPVDPQSRWENDMVPSIKETRARIKALEEQERLFAVPPSAQQSPPETGGRDSAPLSNTISSTDE